ncbi:alanine--tRNA ligase [Akkermansiaceae bacterium]|nr:alanine--tRNA ligase [Akkermansiaceae bacterium]MDB4472140.1 alanine--tRNA ligase [Akkermansiaceae bacterium]MDB4524976.1 alanine--tRNA ligase [bacterium]MDB4556731.1 alanine--tRNA ligase [Akkermansiaceae bacterium]MDB4573558.1 alanine--tRNA ligase [bacterium]
MTSAEIRNSFLDFFKEKQHTTVPSASILPQSPGLLFTNAGMNQFVPYFLGTEKAPYDPPRAADTQKCIRAGGKHNDLEDVGYDTYHHTFFEMLGNWSFGNYFKEEAIAWAWELVVERWGLPANRLYATVYAPSEGDPSEFDHEAYQLWKGFFEKAGLDPKIHIVNGNVEDNFWKMGDTGPCGPCSELHVDMTPNGDTGGKLVNMDSDLCIEIWNLVFIQYNAEEDGTYRDLPSKHVDTGMGFERVCSLIQNTKNFTDFSKKPTNYATDVFQPIFRMLEKLSGKKYVDVYPGEESDALEQAIAFRVIADHIRTLSFSIADSIIPGNTGRNYVLRRILRRAVKYGRTLGFNGNEPFLPRLVDTLVEEFSHVFPEIKTRAAVIKETLTLEEESFNKTLDRGMEKFEKAAGENVFPPEDAFQLYDTFGFPLDLTALLCRERGITLDEKAVEARMEEARKLSRASQKKMVVRATEISTDVITEFLGFEKNSCEAIVLEIHGNLVITDKTVFFTEMGGQEGDTGTLNDSTITSTQQIGSAIAHQIEGNIPAVGDTVDLTINRERRSHIEAHHTATHLLHWAIHKVISPDASQQGSSVSPDRLTFDFNSKAVTPEQIEAIEERVNSAIKADDTVSWVEVPHSKVKDREDIMQFFGDKYGDLVRVVQIGGGDKTLDGYSMELCGGTHVRKTSDIGIFKIKSEGSTGAGIRRIEAVCGPAAEAFLGEQQEKESAEKSEALAKLAKANEALAKLDAPTLLVPDNARAFEVKNQAIEAEKALKKAQATGAARMADSLIAEKNITENIVISTAGSPALLQELLNGLRKTHFTQAAFIVIDDGNKLHLGAFCGEEGKRNGHGAGTLIQKLGPIAGGKGGGKPDMARGAASDRDKISELATAANTELGL